MSPFECETFKVGTEIFLESCIQILGHSIISTKEVKCWKVLSTVYIKSVTLVNVLYNIL